MALSTALSSSLKATVSMAHVMPKARPGSGLRKQLRSRILTRVTNASSGTGVLAELEWRGLLYDHSDRLGDALAAGPVTGYCGFDPTANSLHVGSLVQVMGLLHLQLAGHRPVVLIGGGTGLIGDPGGRVPRGRSWRRTRSRRTRRGIRRQLERFLDFGGPRGALMRDNAEWLVTAPAVAFSAMSASISASITCSPRTR